MSLTNFAVVFPLDRAMYSPAAVTGGNYLVNEDLLHEDARNPKHKGYISW